MGDEHKCNCGGDHDYEDARGMIDLGDEDDEEELDLLPAQELRELCLYALVDKDVLERAMGLLEDATENPEDYLQGEDYEACKFKMRLSSTSLGLPQNIHHTPLATYLMFKGYDVVSSYAADEGEFYLEVRW